MASNDPVAVDKKELEKAQKLWDNFGTASKWGTVIASVVTAIVVVLVAF